MLIVFCAFVFALLFVPHTVLANSPPPAPWYTVHFANLPQEACYADLLVPLTVDSADYTQAVNLPDGITENSPIITYNEDGYMSYTFHYKLASNQFIIESSSVILFQDSYDHYSKFYDVALKLAILDQTGQILQISEPFTVSDVSFLASVTGNIYYDGDTQQVRIGQEYLPMAILMLSILAILVSVVCEMIVGLFFKMKLRSIVVVNFLSQVLMRLLFAWLYGTVFTSYVWLIVILEIFVYTAEYLIYCIIKRDVSKKKILLYTLVANTVSLIVGLLLFNPTLLAILSA